MDLEALFEVLSSVGDAERNPEVFTADVLSASPDSNAPDASPVKPLSSLGPMMAHGRFGNRC